MQVLLIDDSNTSRLYTKQALVQALPGIAIHEAASGAEAREWLLLNNTDLIVCDLEMDNGDGIEFVQWLRRQPAFSQTRVLVHSAYVDILVKAAMNRYLPIGFLSKPAGLQEFNAALKALWAGNEAPALA